MTTVPLAATLALSLAASPPAGKPAAPAEATPGCVQRALVLPDGVQITRAGTVRLTVAVGEDGTAGSVRVPDSVPGPLATALRAAVRACRFTSAKDGGGAPFASPLSLPIKLEAAAAPPSEAATAPAPTFAPVDSPPPTLGGAPAREREPGCVGEHLQLPPNRLLHGDLRFLVSVAADGRVGSIDLPGALQDDVAESLRKAVAWCEFVPATGGDGTAQPGVATIRLRFTAPGDEERRAQAGQLSREARLASNSCLQRLPSPNLIGHVVVSLRVSEAGRPSEMRISPDNVSASTRLAIFDALALCAWQPALDKEGKPVASTAALALRYR